MDQPMNFPGASKDMLAYLSRLGPVRREQFFSLFRDVIEQPLSKNMVYGLETRHESRVARFKGSKKHIGERSAAKRPLNSFMAFRGFYMTIFEQNQQKEKSPLLTTLWQADLFQAKWTMIARAYSDIRDQVGKAKAPLHAFLELVCPRVGIIAPASYLSQMGWIYLSGQLFRGYVPQRAHFPLEIQVTSLTVNDIVDFCRAEGYFTDGPSAPASSPSTSSSLTMISQPTTMTGVDNSVQTPSTANNAQSPVDQTQHPTPVSTEVMSPFNDGSDPNLFDARHLIEADLLLAASEDEFPYTNQFNPEDKDGLIFDPHGVDPHASYDLNLFLDAEAFLDGGLF